MGSVLEFKKRQAPLSAEYFARHDTPAPGSPTGRLMMTVLEKFPSLTFEQARVKANELLEEAAGKRIYRVPAVLTDQEREARSKGIKARFASKALKEAS